MCLVSGEHIYQMVVCAVTSVGKTLSSVYLVRQMVYWLHGVSIHSTLRVVCVVSQLTSMAGTQVMNSSSHSTGVCVCLSHCCCQEACVLWSKRIKSCCIPIRVSCWGTSRLIRNSNTEWFSLQFTAALAVSTLDSSVSSKSQGDKFFLFLLPPHPLLLSNYVDMGGLMLASFIALFTAECQRMGVNPSLMNRGQL